MYTKLNIIHLASMIPQLAYSNYYLQDLFIMYREMLCLQYFHNIFTTIHRWLVVISSNLNLTLRLFFYFKNNNQ